MSGTALAIAKQQKSYTKDSTGSIDFIKKNLKVPAIALLILVSVDVTSLYIYEHTKD